MHPIIRYNQLISGFNFHLAASARTNVQVARVLVSGFSTRQL
jgi:hypothetical protein